MSKDDFKQFLEKDIGKGFHSRIEFLLGCKKSLDEMSNLSDNDMDLIKEALTNNDIMTAQNLILNSFN